MKVSVPPSSVVRSREVVDVAGDTANPAVSSSVMVSDAPVTVIVSDSAVAWAFAAVPVTVTALSAASTSLFTAAIAAVSVAFAVEPAAITIVESGPMTGMPLIVWARRPMT